MFGLYRNLSIVPFPCILRYPRPLPPTRPPRIPGPTPLCPTHTFQREDAVAQGVHDIVQRGLVRHVEEVFVVGVAGDVLDLVNEGPRVLLPSDVVAQDLGTRVGGGGRWEEGDRMNKTWVGMVK